MCSAKSRRRIEAAPDRRRPVPPVGRRTASPESNRLTDLYLRLHCARVGNGADARKDPRRTEAALQHRPVPPVRR